jgi:glycosyltransferase involved in cell wall biosynthesis
LQQGLRFKKVWLKYFIGPFRRYAVFHATSQQEASDIRATFPGAKVVVVPNGADLSAFVGAQEQDLNKWLQEQFRVKTRFSHFIISLSRLHVVKGYDRLLAAFPAVLATYPKAALLLAGPDDGELAKLTRLADQLGIGQKVFFMGHLDGSAKVDFLASGSVFVMPSHTENFGNAYLEALAAGTPIVASIYTPWQEVEPAGCGRWVDNTPEQIGNAILDLLGRDRQQLRDQAVAHARQYEWRLVAEQMEKNYEDLLVSRGGINNSK